MQWNIPRTNAIKRDSGYTMPTDTFGGQSTYKNDFETHRQAPRNPIKPETNTRLSTDAFNANTGYNQDYTKHALPERVNKPKIEYQPNKVPFDTITTNKSDYTHKDFIQMKSFKPENKGVHSETPFDNVTTNKSDYKQWATRPMFAKKDNEWKPPLGEMDMNTNYSNDFAEKPNVRVQAIRPQQRQKVEGKFEADTTYGKDFQKWSGNRRDLIRTQSEFQLPEIPFDTQTTYQGTFIASKGDAAKSFKPNLQASQPNEPFNSETSYRVEYTKK